MLAVFEEFEKFFNEKMKMVEKSSEQYADTISGTV